MDNQDTQVADRGENDASLTLATYAEHAYLDYAISVVRCRALPEAADGQKPVQRRILYAMQEMGLRADAKPVKSARVVGDVLGKFHPHGDQSAYDALVRLAQDFTLRYPLIDGQGNFGSRDGDGAAAMRYTEARLTKIAALLLDELDQGTVDFVPNYDGSDEEPARLPARLPFVLLNGASGIAVGMATEIPPHNLREVAAAAVAVLRNPKISTDELMQIIPGPDFPGGGQIISSAAEIVQVYAIGRGSLKLRARWSIEELARGQWQLVVTELPPTTSAQKVLEEVEEITNPKVKLGKKSLTPDQLQSKQAMLALLDAVRDEAGRDAPVRLVFEPKSKNIDQQEFINTLLAQTSLESNSPVNLVMVGNDERPRQFALRDILQEWLDFRGRTMTRRTEHSLGKVRDRIHILEGRVAILLNIDKVIKIIRNSDEPKPSLIEAFKLSDRQAEDILEIRLRQLARLEAIKIEQELAELRKEQEDLEGLLASDTAMKWLMVKEIETDTKQFGDARRTLIQEERKAAVEVKVIDEPVTVILSEKGWVRARSGHGLDPAQFSFKPGDSLYAAFTCRTVDTLVALGSNGRAYSVAVSALPGAIGRASGDGVPLTTLIELQAGTTLGSAFAGPAEQMLLLAGSGGYGLLAKVSDLSGRTRAGKSFLSLEDKETPLMLAPVGADARQIACISSVCKMLVFGLDELKHQSDGGRGVILMNLGPGEMLFQAVAFGPAGLAVRGQGRAGKEMEMLLTRTILSGYVGKRARKGKAFEEKWKQLSLLPGEYAAKS